MRTRSPAASASSGVALGDCRFHMLLLCRCRRPPICNASRKKLFEPAGLTQEFRILCWFLGTNAGFENPERDFGNRRRFSETNAGFQNSVRDFENSCWFSKTNAGFENPEQDFENRRRFFRNQRRISKFSAGFRKLVLGFENRHGI